MDIKDAVFLISWAILINVMGFFIKRYKFKYDKLLEEYDRANAQYDLSAKRCIELEKELDFYESCEQIIKVEKVVSQPLELQCRLQFDREFPEDMKQEFIYRRLCEELQKAFKENSDICLIQTEDSLFDMSQNVRVRVRFLPYVYRAEY